MIAHLGVLPSNFTRVLDHPISPQSVRTVCLPHPRTGISSLFLPCELLPDALNPSGKDQILEIQAVAPPDSRSWFLGDDVISDGKLLIMTPVDPAFLLLQILNPLYSADESVGHYLPVDDIFEEASRKYEGPGNGQSSDIPILRKDVIRFGSLQCVKDALRCICDIKEITSEIVVYRPSQAKTLGYLRAKVARISALGTLDASRSIVRTLAKDGLMEDGKEVLLQAGRTRAACDLIGHYLSSDNRALLMKSYDFTELDKHLEKSMEVMPVTSVDKKGKNKRKVVTEEDKKKVAKSSQGVGKLKKANVNGMAKLSSFFTKI